VAWGSCTWVGSSFSLSSAVVSCSIIVSIAQSRYVLLHRGYIVHSHVV
jgi:hypothetical protein